jgi:hypothetical protein
MSFPETTRFWARLGAADGDEQGEEQQDESLSLKSEFFRQPLPPAAVAGTCDPDNVFRFHQSL